MSFRRLDYLLFFYWSASEPLTDACAATQLTNTALNSVASCCYVATLVTA